MENKASCGLPDEVVPASPVNVEIPDGKHAETSWVFVRDRLYKPFSKDTSNQANQYIACYTAVVNLLLCSKKYNRPTVSDKFYANIRVLLQENLQSGVKPALSLRGDNLVSFYISSWGEFVAGAKHNSGVLMYMTRHYVMRERDEGNLDVYTGKQLHALCWKEEIFDKLENELRSWARMAEGEEESSRGEKFEAFKKCYNELREELKGSGKEISPWDEFCSTP